MDVLRAVQPRAVHRRPRFWLHFPAELTPLRGDGLPRRLEKRPRRARRDGAASRDPQFFVDERYGIADIALYAYTHVAHEGGFDLARYPNVRAWLERVAAQPGHVAIDHSSDQGRRKCR